MEANLFEDTNTQLETCSNTVDSRYLEFQGTLLNTSGYPYLDLSDLQNWGKNNSHNLN